MEKILNHFIIGNGKVILEDSTIDNGYVEVENGQIKGFGNFSELQITGNQNNFINKCKSPISKNLVPFIDVKNNYISPGLIDIHNHGCFGQAVYSNTPENILKLTSQLTSAGVTTFLPTTISLPTEEIITSIENILNAKEKNTDGARIEGINLEGPFISKAKAGAQFLSFIKEQIDFNDIKLIIEKGKEQIKIVTLAVELNQSIELIKYLVSKNIIPSAGHTNANYEQMQNGFKEGVELVTHLFSAMSGIHHREPGAAGAALLNQNIYCEVICDGFHIHPDVVKLIFKCKDWDKIILITDSTLFAGLGDGEFSFGPFKVIVSNGKACLDKGPLAGSTLTLNKAVYNAIKFTESQKQIEKIIKMASLNPATLLKIDNKLGSINVGKLADIVVFDDSFIPQLTLIEGKIVYKKN